MKTLLILFCLVISLVTSAQSAPTSIRKRIADDEKTLSIQIDGVQNGQPVHYDRSFDVAGMNRLQKEWLTFRTFQSQGIALSIHDVSWLLLLVLGMISLMVTLLIIIYQAQQASNMSAVKGF
ncbi:MAG TPA: hypothetical protein VGA96_14805 [Fibrella sp.]|jgi:lipoprotein signal peptidase